jgi:glutaredoxin
MIPIKFYMKDGCWLCDATQETLNGLKERYGIEIERIEIDRDPDLYELYRFDIPVIEFPGGETLYSQIKRKELLRLLDDYSKRGD